VFLAFALGIASAFVVLWVRPHFEPMLPRGPSVARNALDSFAVTSLVEETVKLLAVLPLCLFAREWDEPLDGIVYGAAVALGFASVENAFYLASSGEIALVLARAFTATLLHVSCTGGVAFVLGCVRLRRCTRAWALLAFAVVVAAHGTYDLIVSGVPKWSPVALLVVLPCLLAGLALATGWARDRSREYHPEA
jgi:RsiW-degrading membrane proteinase PrsW (M82 family)